MGCEPGTRVIHAQLVHADEDDREKLMESGDHVLEVLRLRTADHVPVMLETNRFSRRYEWLMQENLSASLYAVLREHGVEADQAIHEISLCYATPQQAKLLDMEPGSALMQLYEVIYDQHGLPLHTSRQVIRGDRFTFRI